METRNWSKELRIGNWVNTGATKQPIVLNRKRFEYAVCKDCCYAIEPIPLTEEWLLRFGFKKLGSEFTNKSKFWIDEGNAIWKNSTIGEVKHVHQLQNLYHSLCGEELEINLTQE